MVLRKILAVLAMLGAAALLIYAESDFASYLGAFLLALAVCLPLIALGLSLPAMLGLRVRVAPQQGSVLRGGQALWFLDVGNRRRLPLSRIELRLELRSRMTGQCRPERLRLSGAGSLRRLALPADTAHCDLLECRVVKIKVWDCLGLFSLRRKVPNAALLPVLPVPGEPLPLPEGARDPAQSAALQIRPGGGLGEDYDLRPYRPGDPVRLIHWKLSSKRDELIIREVLEAKETVPVLTFDHFGPRERLDQVLDQLWSLCAMFLERQKTHTVRWLHPETGDLREFCVAGQRELLRCIQAALCDPAPLTGCSICPALPASAGEGAVSLRVIPAAGRQGELQIHIEPAQEGTPCARS